MRACLHRQSIREGHRASQTQEQPVKFLADVCFSRGLPSSTIVPHLDGCGLSFSVMGRENGVTRDVRQVGNGIVNGDEMLEMPR
jgi:hypothetical protein